MHTGDLASFIGSEPYFKIKSEEEKKTRKRKQYTGIESLILSGVILSIVLMLCAVLLFCTFRSSEKVADIESTADTESFSSR